MELVAQIRALWEELGMQEEWEQRCGQGGDGESDEIETCLRNGAEDELKVLA
jgi:hypothetical protein